MIKVTNDWINRLHDSLVLYIGFKLVFAIATTRLKPIYNANESCNLYIYIYIYRSIDYDGKVVPLILLDLSAALHNRFSANNIPLS